MATAEVTMAILVSDARLDETAGGGASSRGGTGMLQEDAGSDEVLGNAMRSVPAAART